MEETKSLDAVLATIGKNLRLLRHHKKNNEKISTTAQAVHISEPTLSKIESGNYPPVSLTTLYALAKYFNVELTDLFSRSDDEQQQATSNRIIEFLHQQNSVENTLQHKIQQKPANEILIPTQNNIDN